MSNTNKSAQRPFFLPKPRLMDWNGEEVFLISLWLEGEKIIGGIAREHLPGAVEAVHLPDAVFPMGDGFDLAADLIRAHIRAPQVKGKSLDDHLGAPPGTRSDQDRARAKADYCLNAPGGDERDRGDCACWSCVASMLRVEREAERERCAKVACSDCRLGLPRKRTQILRRASDVSSGDPPIYGWFHDTRPGYSRECEADAIWTPVP